MAINFTKKTKIALWISMLFFGLFLISAPNANAEVISNFSSTINVLPDSSILVNEKITYDFEDSIRHGILRTIPLLNSNKETIKIEVISVTNDTVEKYTVSTDNSNKTITIKIGDPDRMVSGIKEYIISYRVWGSITYYDNYDEIYWNTTGNDWQVPILKSEVKVVLPNNVFPIHQSCYYGKLGSKTQCSMNETNTFSSETILSVNEGLTIAVGFPKGIVSFYKNELHPYGLFNIYIFWPALIPIITFLIMFILWYKKGKDKKSSGVIIPQYNVPDDLSPLEVGAIVNGEIRNQNIPAEIIYLATKGFLSIKQISADCDNFLCIIPGKDYQFTLLKEEGLLKNSFDRKIISTIFQGGSRVGGTVKLSTLNSRFYKSISKIDDEVRYSLINKKYFTNFPKFSIKRQLFLYPLMVIIIFLTIMSMDLNNQENLLFDKLIFIMSVILAFSIYIIFSKILPARSYKGALSNEYLLGLKDYIQTAEKDRINFHNAPDKKPEIFEQLLPYAMVFGVEELWANEFKDIYIMPPQWYENRSEVFNVINFGREMSTFSSLATSSLSSSPSSSGGGDSSGSGSSGSGSSGGGGGGGGGRSW